MNEQNAKQEPWSADLPNEQGYYWHWNGNEDDAPFIHYVMFSGTSGKHFVSRNTMPETPFVEDVGGFWVKIEPPASAPADAPTGKIVVERYIVEESGEMRIEPGSTPTDAPGDAGEGPTPETDALAFRVGKNQLHPDTVVVAVNDARKLERTIATLRAECERLREDKARCASQIVKPPEVMFAVYARHPDSENWFEQETNTDESLVREWRDRNNERSPQLYDPPREYILVKKETTFTKLP